MGISNEQVTSKDRREVEKEMTTIQLLEALLILAGVIGTFLATLKYLIRFQRKIDRLLILGTLTRNRLEDVEDFLEKDTDFKAKKRIDATELPELNTDFV